MRKKTKYTILDDMDDQERVELRPKHGEPSVCPLLTCLSVLCSPVCLLTCLSADPSVCLSSAHLSAC